MRLKDLRTNWNMAGELDPLWAICELPAKRGRRWDRGEFFQTGEVEVAAAMSHLDTLGFVFGRRRALDFGCGVGRLTQALARHFEQVDGVDIAPSMLRLADQFNRYGSRCRYHLNVAADLHCFPDNEFDCVYSKITLQHMPPLLIRSYLREFLRVLRPQGALAFQLPDRAPVTRTAIDLLASVKRVVKASVPDLVLVFRRVLKRPETQMHGIPREEVLESVRAWGGTVIDVQPDDSAKPMDGYQYYVTKHSSENHRRNRERMIPLWV